ncbi:MAG: hypothetical protein M1426_03355 [Patescibacteria group bacterium]|nr:hypothetical protein [Patescibacteria group bacterium]
MTRWLRQDEVAGSWYLAKKGLHALYKVHSMEKEATRRNGGGGTPWIAHRALIDVFVVLERSSPKARR